MSDRPEYYIAVMGGYKVGKTAVVMRLISGEFPDVHDPTIEESYTKRMQVTDDTVALVSILDTPGHKDFDTLLNPPMRSHNGFLLVYDVSKKKSFERITTLIERIKTEREGAMPACVILANKIDKKDKGDKKARVVTPQEGQALADKFGCGYMEYSAKTGQDLNVGSDKNKKDDGEDKDKWRQPFLEVIQLILNPIAPKTVDDSLPEKAQSDSKVAPAPMAVETHAAPAPAEKTCCSSLFSQQVIGPAPMRFAKLQKLPEDKIPPDTFPLPVLSLKNHRIRRDFDYKRTLKAIALGFVMPFVLTYQTCQFLIHYCKPNKTPTWLPDSNDPFVTIDYGNSHDWALYDLGGLVVGRYPVFDAEDKKDREYFVYQTGKQILQRIALTILSYFMLFLVAHNLLYSKQHHVYSRMETVGPCLLYCVLWTLFAAWIGYHFEISDDLPDLRELRGLHLFFGRDFRYKTAVYTLLRSYQKSKAAPWSLNLWQHAICITVAALYSLTPGITRVSLNDQGFWPQRYFLIVFGAFIVNFLFVSMFIVGIFALYARKYQHYKAWMTELTYLLATKDKKVANDKFREIDDVSGNRTFRTQTMLGNTLQVQIEHGDLEAGVGGAGIGDNTPYLDTMFLSLRRHSNIVGWLDLRSYLIMEASLLFGQQELPTLWLLIASMALIIFITFRAYFIAGNAYESTLWNGISTLTLVCFVSLITIVKTTSQFLEIQNEQERLIAEQAFLLKCHRTERKGRNQNRKQFTMRNLNPDADPDGGADHAADNEPTPALSAAASDDNTPQLDDAKEDSKLSLSDELPEFGGDEDSLSASDLEDGDAVAAGGGDAAGNGGDDAAADAEKKPLIGKKKVKKQTRLFAADDTYNLDFILTMADVVSKKRIVPVFFGLPLDVVLMRVVFFMLVLAVICFFRVMVSTTSGSDE